MQLPPELEKLFHVLEHELPGRQQLLEIASGLVSQADDLPSGVELDQVLDATAGLTRFEAENAFSLALTRHDRISATTIWELSRNL